MRVSDLQHTLPSGPKLNLGCGPVQPDGWVNIDGSNRAWLISRLTWLDRLLVKMRLLPPTPYNASVQHRNLLKGLPYADPSVACIYAGELWEHFEPADGLRLAEECYRVLAPGGVLRICVPDGPEFWEEYLQIFRDMMAKPRSERSAQPLQEHVQMYFKEIYTKRRLFSSFGHVHKWQYDEIQLIDMFEKCGFADVERMAFRHSRIPNIDQVERSDFLIVEGIKS